MRTETKDGAIQRLKDSKEFLDSASDNLEKQRFKAAVDNAADAAISANDAFTAFLIGEVASSDHQEAIKIHKDAGSKISENKSDQLRELLNMRHQLTYRSVAVPKGTAFTAVQRAKKFVEWVEIVIGLPPTQQI